MLKELFGVTEGIICQQCNCRGAYGAGLSGAIADKYPVVFEAFKKDYSDRKGNQFGTYQLIRVATNRVNGKDKPLFVANIYSQDGYKGSTSTENVKYTDTEKLVAGIKEIALYYKETPVYVPHSVDKNGNHNGIGCGLAGEKWENLYPKLQALKLPNLYLLDTFTGEREKVKPLEKRKELEFER